jgi:hypothetical protein
MPNALSIQSGLVRAVRGESTLSAEYQLVSGILANYPEAYVEYSYTDSNLTGISIWDNSEKDTLLITKTFAYTDGNLTTKTVVDVVASKTVTVTYGYTSGNLTSKSTTIS